MAVNITTQSTLTSEELELGQKSIQRLRDNLEQVIQGKSEPINVLLMALIANNSILMEDVPGVGKTTLAKALAGSIGSKYSRIQFTPDLLPADILGGSVYNPQDGSFNFRSGPIFCNILLADEINRASPRTQSALLEAMAEMQVTIENDRHLLPSPFLVIATQNPVEFHGTYPLPEAQLDRFMALLHLGYPAQDDEVSILQNQAESQPVDRVTPVLSQEEVVTMQKNARRVTIEMSIIQYIVELVNQTREDGRLSLGVSPRGSLMLYHACQAKAFMEGRAYVLPDDVQHLAVPVLAHRIVLDTKSKYDGTTKNQIIADILDTVPVPA
jgi:MoxR-like ATPase